VGFGFAAACAAVCLLPSPAHRSGDGDSGVLYQRRYYCCMVVSVWWAEGQVLDKPISPGATNTFDSFVSFFGDCYALV
jgi:hypothetical protein